MIIVGYRSFVKVLFKMPEMNKCIGCGAVINYNITRIAMWFTIFYIPIFPFYFKYYIACPNCDKGKKITRQEAKILIKQGQEKKV